MREVAAANKRPEAISGRQKSRGTHSRAHTSPECAQERIQPRKNFIDERKQCNAV